MPSYNLNSDNTSPSEFAAAVTPADGTDLTNGICRGLFIGVAGNVNLDVGGATVLFKGLSAGSILPVRASRVRATSTTATDIVALY